MTTAAVQASKNAFIVFHLAGLAECENNMMPGYAWYKDADRHDSSSLTGALHVFRDGKLMISPGLLLNEWLWLATNSTSQTGWTLTLSASITRAGIW